MKPDSAMTMIDPIEDERIGQGTPIGVAVPAANLRSARTWNVVQSEHVVPQHGHKAGAEFSSMEMQPPQWISVDVFDTLLYREPVSERRRFYQSASAFVRLCSGEASPTVSSVWEARSEANRWAYHSIDTLARDAEVKLNDIFKRQLLILGLPLSLLPLLLKAEIEVEKSVLKPNKRLIAWLRTQRARQIPVIAISDTCMPSEALQEIIDGVAGCGAIDRLYTSADLGVSKRNGGIFAVVAAMENMAISEQFHFGDDRRADVVQARAAGIIATHLPRSRAFVARRKLDGVLFETGLWASHPGKTRRVALAADKARGDVREFGRRVLGPIFARYCLRVWLYLSFANESGEEAVALFCARGGLNLRVMLDTFLERLNLPLTVPRRDLMISRLVAVRAALLQNSKSALDEIEREFRGASMASVARAIAQVDIAFGQEWDAPFESEVFLRLMKTTHAGEEFCRRITEQNTLFEAHLEMLASKKTRLILCDTGLFGSTVKMLQGGIPDRQWECLLFARCNYKDAKAEHFAQTRGVVCDQDMYDPIQASTVVLRFWQLFEHICEPGLESVKTFAQKTDGSIASNLESEGWQQRLEATRSPLLEGILDYLRALPREGWFDQVCGEERVSWKELKGAVLFPDAVDVRTLDSGERSVDFGRDETYETLERKQKSSFRQKLRTLSTVRWKEGFVTQEFSILRLWFQAGIESVYLLRWVRCRLTAALK